MDFLTNTKLSAASSIVSSSEIAAKAPTLNLPRLESLESSIDKEVALLSSGCISGISASAQPQISSNLVELLNEIFEIDDLELQKNSLISLSSLNFIELGSTPFLKKETSTILLNMKGQEDFLEYLRSNKKFKGLSLEESYRNIEREMDIFDKIINIFFVFWLDIHNDLEKQTFYLKKRTDLMESHFVDEKSLQRGFEYLNSIQTTATHKEKRKNLKKVAAKHLKDKTTSEIHPLDRHTLEWTKHNPEVIKNMGIALNMSRILLADTSHALKIQFERITDNPYVVDSTLSEKLESQFTRIQNGLTHHKRGFSKTLKVVRLLQYMPLYLLITKPEELKEIFETSLNLIGHITDVKIPQFTKRYNLPYTFCDPIVEDVSATILKNRRKLVEINFFNEPVYQETTFILKHLHYFANFAETLLLKELEQLIKRKKICSKALLAKQAAEASSVTFTPKNLTESSVSITPPTASSAISGGSSSTFSIDGTDESLLSAEELVKTGLDQSAKSRSKQNVAFLLNHLSNSDYSGVFHVDIFECICHLSTILEETFGTHNLMEISDESLSEHAIGNIYDLNRVEIRSRRAFTKFFGANFNKVSEILSLCLSKDPSNYPILADKFNQFLREFKATLLEINPDETIDFPIISTPTSTFAIDATEELSSLLTIFEERGFNDLHWNSLRLISLLSIDPRKENFTHKYGMALHLVYVIAEESIFEFNPGLNRKETSHSVIDYLDAVDFPKDLSNWLKTLYKESVAGRFYDIEKSSHTEIHHSVRASFTPITHHKPKFKGSGWHEVESEAMTKLKQSLENHIAQLHLFVSTLFR